MSMTTITARIVDQTVTLENLPLLASGSVDSLQIRCEFCELWTNYGKVAVFYREGGEVYHIPLELDDSVKVPHEVLTEAGPVFFGIMGTATNTRTTEVIRLNLVRGAITTATADHETPAPDIYSQLLAAMAVSNGRISQIVKMGSSQGAIVSSLSAEYVTGQIKSNGAVAYIRFEIADLSLTGGGYHFTDYCIKPALAPLGPVYLQTSNLDLNVTIEAPNNSGWSRILVENVSSSYYSSDMITTCEAFYPLASVSISELADVRVGYDGSEYDTAGEAVRQQIADLTGYSGGGGGTTDPAIFEQMIELYNEAIRAAEEATQAANDAANVLLEANPPKIYIQDAKPTDWSHGDIWLKPTAAVL